jgi:hypothetical protein
LRSPRAPGKAIRAPRSLEPLVASSTPEGGFRRALWSLGHFRAGRAGIPAPGATVFVASAAAGAIVFFGRFVAILRVFAAILAGANKLAPVRFFFYNAAGGIVWATIFGLGAYTFGRNSIGSRILSA